MTHQVYIPIFPLSNFIECFVYYKDYNPAHSIDRFLPDGNINLVIDLTDYPKYIYDNETLRELQACERVWFSGIRNKYITIPSGRDSEMFLIYFKKGKSYPFVNAPVSEFTDHVVDGEQVLSNEILTLRDRLLELPTLQHKFRFAEHFLLNLFRRKMEENPFVDYAVQQIVRNPDSAVIKTITNNVGYSQKHMIDIFRRHVGISPKAFLRVMRFQKAIREIEHNRQVNWTSIAYESGYYDQAHFINDFKIFSGFTPSQYLSMHSESINYVAVG